MTPPFPCHNAAPWIAETLQSCLSQMWPRIEIIVIDDRSVDASAEIIRGYSKHGVRLEACKRAGAAAARNQALRLASGDFIQFLDADDLIAPGKITAQMRRLAGQSSHNLCHGPWTTFHSIPPSDAALIDRDSIPWDLPAHEILRMKVHPKLLIPVSSWLCPRELLDEVGPWNESISVNDDGEYFARVLSRAKDVLWCEGAWTFYRQSNAASLSRTEGRLRAESMFLSFVETEKALRVTGVDSSDTARLAEMWAWLAIHLYPDFKDISARCARLAASHGKKSMSMQGSPLLSFVSQTFGWRVARSIQVARLRLRTRRTAENRSAAKRT